MIRLALALAVLALVNSAAHAQQRAPRSIDDCEKITEAMAYNACLAAFGPAPGERPRAGSVEQAEDLPPRGKVRGARAASGRAIPAGAIDGGRRANGRQFLVIQPTRKRR